MPSQEGEEIIVKSLELESVLDLVWFDEWVDYQANWDGFYLLEQILEIGQIHLSYSLVLRAFHQREDQTF